MQCLRGGKFVLARLDDFYNFRAKINYIYASFKGLEVPALISY